ncbi:hypothetical protein SLA2020_397580 [Shorea laevis]
MGQEGVGTRVKPVSASIQQCLSYFFSVGFDNDMTCGVGGSPAPSVWVAAHAPSATAGPINLYLKLLGWTPPQSFTTSSVL